MIKSDFFESVNVISNSNSFDTSGVQLLEGENTTPKIEIHLVDVCRYP